MKYKTPVLAKTIAKSLLGISLLFIVIWFRDIIAEQQLPTSDQPVILYSPQTRDDLRLLFRSAIEEAKESVFLAIYALSDEMLISALRAKSEEGVKVHVICDKNATIRIGKKLGRKVHFMRRMGQGLMHQKILVIDEKKIWIGSANWTTQSLRFHGNLILGLECPSMAKDLSRYMYEMQPYRENSSLERGKYKLAGSTAELFILPQPEAANRLIHLINQAEKTVCVAMFTWTYQPLAEALVKAQERGVKTMVVLDQNSAKGSGAKVTEYLKKRGIPVFVSQGNTLLHHKFMWIDQKILVNGSANWTKAAFNRNDDNFVILDSTTPEQQDKLNDLWEITIQEAHRIS